MILLTAILMNLDTVKNYLDHTPKETKCQKVFLWKRCSELNHFRNYDYINFKWWDEATYCNDELGLSVPGMPIHRPDVCVAVGPKEYRAYRMGCIVRVCKETQ